MKALEGKVALATGAGSPRGSNRIADYNPNQWL